MHGSCGLWALLLLLATAGPTTALKEDEKQLMVQLHNLYRTQVSPPASDMLQMRWDPELAAFAKAYAQKCVWGHNKDRGRRGENLFAITDEGLDLPLAVEEWHHEREHYNFSAAVCATGQMCGHYTQVVWSKTERIGCGSHFCETLQGVEETNIHLLVCNYEPPGNVKGQRPYLEGKPCSQCPLDYSCENALCEPVRGPEEAQELTPLVTEGPSTVADEALGPGKTNTPSLATETPSFSGREVSGSLATTAPPTVGTKAPSSLGKEEPASMATKAPPSQNAEVPSISATATLLFSEEDPGPLPRSTHLPVLRAAHDIASKTSTSPTRPESSQHPTGEPQPRALEEVEAEVKVPSSSEVLASVLPARAQPGEPQATLGHPKSLPNFPSDSASGNAIGGRTLALQSSLPGADGPEKPSRKPPNSSGHTWAHSSGLLLLPPLLWAGLL
ncbi:peptidase inhibitor 16 [Octodon degus]|uniref:Peptidase inhibitor 16 n=1 Tax=Octodon degus TaxID=10160 RepID=A0A6P3ERI0_OCTDE|nr:peptidase inhibitor 16 [Octodon degus]